MKGEDRIVKTESNLPDTITPQILNAEQKKTAAPHGAAAKEVGSRVEENCALSHHTLFPRIMIYPAADR
jgi:hypothetical protein